MPSLQALCCGRLTFDRSQFFPDEAPGVQTTIPVPSFLIVHPKGRLLFDTGIECNAASDPAGLLGERIARIYRLTGSPSENVIAQLALHGLAPEDITHVVTSHLHFDHCGCNRLRPRARILVQKAEMDAARAPDSRYDRRLWDHPLDYQLVDGEHDVFGDGTVVLIPTPGHTVGHQSLVVQVSRDRRYVLRADACYSKEHMDREVLPSVVWNAPTMLESMAKLRRLGEQAGTRVLYGHDPAQWVEVEAAGGMLG